MGGTEIASALNINNPKKYGEVFVTKNAFIVNRAFSAAALSIGDVKKVTVRNNLFLGNKTTSGPNISLGQSNQTGIYFINNTVYQNGSALNSANFSTGLSLYVSGSSKALIANNILWGNDSNDLRISGNGYTYLHNNDIGSYTGNADSEINNISVNPGFAPFYFFKYILSGNSPLIDQGKNPPPYLYPPSFINNWSAGHTDIEGNSRITGDKIDMGVFEYSAPRQ